MQSASLALLVINFRALVPLEFKKAYDSAFTRLSALALQGRNRNRFQVGFGFDSNENLDLDPHQNGLDLYHWELE